MTPTVQITLPHRPIFWDMLPLHQDTALYAQTWRSPIALGMGGRASAHPHPAGGADDHLACSKQQYSATRFTPRQDGRLLGQWTDRAGPSLVRGPERHVPCHRLRHDSRIWTPGLSTADTGSTRAHPGRDRPFARPAAFRRSLIGKQR